MTANVKELERLQSRILSLSQDLSSKAFNERDPRDSSNLYDASYCLDKAVEYLTKLLVRNRA